MKEPSLHYQLSGSKQDLQSHNGHYKREKYDHTFKRQTSKFSQMLGGLYTCNPKLKEKEHQNQISKRMQNHLIVNKNTQYISKRQLKRAQDVKRLQNALGMPSYKDKTEFERINCLLLKKKQVKI